MSIVSAHPCSATARRGAAQLNSLYDRASRLVSLGVWECDLATDRLTWTAGVYDLFDIPRQTTLRRADIIDLYHADSRLLVERLRAEAIRDGVPFTIEAQIRTRRGEDRWMRLSAGVEFEDGRPVRLFGAKQDVTRERERVDHLRQLADCDPLTGLANRRAFDRGYEALMRRAGQDGSRPTLLLIDVDRFKEVNDRFGHAAGDECLRETASRLHRRFGDAALVARIGGDEFAVLLGGAWVLPGDGLEGLQAALSRPVFWKTERLEIAASIGMATLGVSMPRDSSRLFVEADAALYVAKASRR